MDGSHQTGCAIRQENEPNNDTYRTLFSFVNHCQVMTFVVQNRQVSCPALYGTLKLSQTRC